MMLTDGDYICRMIQLPGDINSVLRVDCEGFGNIYINDLLSPSEKKKAFEHEYKHFLREDMFSDDGIREVES